MRISSFNIYGFVLLISFLSIPTAGYACSCVETPSPQVALNQADAVFVGRAENITTDNKFSLGSSVDPVLISFEVSTVWKGNEQNNVEVMTVSGSESCGYSFDLGKEYLVYAFKNDRGELQTNICTRTTPLSAAQDDLQALGEGRSPYSPTVSIDQEPLLEGWALFLLLLMSTGAVWYVFRMKKV
ncbi:hypothetical protein [Ammoniphilus sp. CFH 90114]|uniref:hypothetical protein n=1 Tax=Ammoniphilus sp. CFH 90114 TaxID=2493665 RepID=UPI00100F0DB7|nr:hypothetical protein [Ammoniphilus sp. CFH 90114]RXT06563.1 hypothetical protein EIZ39_16005 [Ammoniphilus sp. CFH 90114]